MPEFRFVQLGRGLGLKGWILIISALALFVGMVLAIAVLAVGLFLFLLPVMAVASLAYWLLQALSGPSRNAGNVIEGEFRVIEAADRHRSRRD